MTTLYLQRLPNGDFIDWGRNGMGKHRGYGRAKLYTGNQGQNYGARRQTLRAKAICWRGAMILKDVPVGVVCALIENIGDEVRHTFYERADGPTIYDRNVKVFSLGCIQGIPDERSRYDSRGGRHSSEAHAKLPVVVMDMPKTPPTQDHRISARGENMSLKQALNDTLTDERIKMIRKEIADNQEENEQTSRSADTWRKQAIRLTNETYEQRQLIEQMTTALESVEQNELTRAALFKAKLLKERLS